MKIPDGMKEIFEMSPLLKYATWVTPYFVSEEDGSTEKSKERITDFQTKITKMIKTSQKRSKEQKGKKARKIHPATEKELARWDRYQNSALGVLRARLQIRMLQYGTPQFKANFLRDLGATVGKKVMITFGNLIDVIFARNITIGDATTFGMGAVLLCEELIDGELYVGNVEIGHNTLIGAGAIILPGVKIGSNCIVTPGIVSYDVPDNTLCVGLPEDVRVPLEGDKIQLADEKRKVEKTPWDLFDWRQFLPSMDSLIVKNILLQVQKLPMTQPIRQYLLKLAGLKIGKNVRIEENVNFDPWFPEKITIEDGAILKKYSVISTHEGMPPKESEIKGSFRVGEVIIGKNVLLESGTGVLPGVHINDNAEVLPYTFIATDVKEGIQVVGIPSRKVGETFDIKNFMAQSLGYHATAWDEIQKIRKEEDEEHYQERLDLRKEHLDEVDEEVLPEDMPDIQEPKMDADGDPWGKIQEIADKDMDKIDDVLGKGPTKKFKVLKTDKLRDNIIEYEEKSL